MNVLGLRFSNSDYAYAIMNGKKVKPIVRKVELVNYPKGFSTPKALDWQLKELIAIIKSYEVRVIVIKGFEGPKRDKTFVERIEHEAMAFLADEHCGLRASYRKVGKTIAKDLGLAFGFKGKTKYLFTSLDVSLIPNYDSYDAKCTDAIRAAWSALR